MNFDDSFAKRRPVPILTRENCDQWFTLMRRWLIEEDLWNVVEVSAVNTPASGSSAPFPLGNLGFGSQKTDAKALYWLTICINVDDQEYLADKTSAKDVWDALKAKYKEKLQTTGRQYLAEFIGYKMPDDVSIEEAWTHLSKLGRKIAATQPDMAGLSKPERRFQALLQALPDEYVVIRDAIDAQDNPDVERGLQKLQEKEAQLKAGETATALWADKQKGGQRSMNQNCSSLNHRTADTKRQYHRSSSSDSDHPPRRSTKCFLCNGPHFIQDCKFLPDAKRDVQKKASRSTAVKLHRLTAVKSHQKPAYKGKGKRHRAFDAEVSDSDDDDSSSESEEEEEVGDEIAALSKEAAMAPSYE